MSDTVDQIAEHLLKLYQSGENVIFRMGGYVHILPGDFHEQIAKIDKIIDPETVGAYPDLYDEYHEGAGARFDFPGYVVPCELAEALARLVGWKTENA